MCIHRLDDTDVTQKHPIYVKWQSIVMVLLVFVKTFTCIDWSLSGFIGVDQ